MCYGSDKATTEPPQSPGSLLFVLYVYVALFWQFTVSLLFVLCGWLLASGHFDTAFWVSGQGRFLDGRVPGAYQVE